MICSDSCQLLQLSITIYVALIQRSTQVQSSRVVIPHSSHSHSWRFWLSPQVSYYHGGEVFMNEPIPTFQEGKISQIITNIYNDKCFQQTFKGNHIKQISKECEIHNFLFEYLLIYSTLCFCRWHAGFCGWGFVKRLGDILAARWERPYSIVMGQVRAHLPFAVLQAALLWVSGSCTK